MSVPQPAPRRKSLLNLRTTVLLVLVVAITLFCVFNQWPVHVWPFGNAPLIVVILVSFALGLGVGWLAKSILGGRHNLAPDESVMERNIR